MTELLVEEGITEFYTCRYYLLATHESLSHERIGSTRHCGTTHNHAILYILLFSSPAAAASHTLIVEVWGGKKGGSACARLRTVCCRNLEAEVGRG